MMEDKERAMDAFGLMELQGSTDLMTKTELMEAIRDRGLSISDRTITYYMSERVLPKAVRVGSRAGAYPKIVVDLLGWVLRARERDLAVESIRELLPVWEFLVRSRRSGEVALTELEYIARERVTSPEANYAVPWLVRQTMGCSQCAGHVEWILKDNSRIEHADGMTVTFHLAELDEHDPTVAHRIDWIQLPLPGFAPDITASDAVILGVPNGVTVRCDGACRDTIDPEVATSVADADELQEVGS